MRSEEIIKMALSLKSQERFLIIESLLESLDKPDPELDKIWTEEAQKRLKAYRSGKIEGYSLEDVIKDLP